MLTTLFEFDGKPAQITADGSYVWGDSEFRSQQDEFRILAAFESQLLQLSQNEERSGQRRRLIDIVTSHARSAFIWKRLLVLGQKAPSTLGHDLRSLGWSRPILLRRDTSTEAIRFLARVFPYLSPDERTQAEMIVLSYPEEATSSDQRIALERLRDRHLSQLPEDLLTMEARRRVRLHLETGNEPSDFEHDNIDLDPPAGILASIAATIQASVTPQDSVVSLPHAVWRWTDSHTNGPPEPIDVAQFLSTLGALHKQLTSPTLPESGDVSEVELEWDILADACERIASIPRIACDGTSGGTIGRFVRDVLLAAAGRLHPVTDPSDDELFDTEHVHWGSPAARREAALGLVRLLAAPSCVNSRVLQAIDRLSQDAVPSIRLFVVGSANALLYRDEHLMWTILERASATEPRLAVLHALVSGPLARLGAVFPDRIAELLRKVFDRSPGMQAQFVRAACIEVATSLFIVRQQSMARTMVVNAIGAADPDDREVYGSRVARVLRGYLRGDLHVSTAVDDGSIQRRAITLLEQMTTLTAQRLAELDFGGEPEFADLPPEVQEEIQSLLKLLDSITMELYFASGAHDYKHNRFTTQPLSLEEKKNFLRETDAVMDELARFMLPHATDNLLQMLNYLSDADPKGVFVKIGKIVRAGERYGYQYDPLAVPQVVRIVERYLADFRTHLRESSECRDTLVAILDTFVRVGSKEAIRLSYRLNEIYR